MTKQVKGVDPHSNRKTAYKYSYQVATLNEAQYASMKDKFACLAKLVKRPVWLSMFEQTHYELELSRYLLFLAQANALRYLQEHLDVIKSDGNQLKFWLDTLCATLSGYTPKAPVPGANSSIPAAVAPDSPFGISPHTASVLRNLILFIGSTWVEESKKLPELRRVLIRQPGAQEGPGPGHIVDLLGFSGAPQPQARPDDNVVDISVYLAEKIGSVGGLYWASGLLQVWLLIYSSNFQAVRRIFTRRMVF